MTESADKTCPTCGATYPSTERFCPKDGSVLRTRGSADLIGSVIAERYHVIRKLGEGGMGQVYLAEHVKMGRRSAVKVMHPGTHHDAEAVSRFNREAANASRITHPNVAVVYDFGETADGTMFLAMEFIEGETLTTLLEREGSLAPARAAELARQIAEGLAAAHELGIVHRDLKPDNIMITKGRGGADLVKVVDFGIAKAMGGDDQMLTRTGLSVGTPEYMSPEQFAADHIEHTSDIYSLGLVAFGMLAGRLPFRGASPQELMVARFTDEPRTLAEVRPDIPWPRAVLAVMKKALERRCEDRYQSASAFGEDLVAAIGQMPGQDIQRSTSADVVARAAGMPVRAATGEEADNTSLHANVGRATGRRTRLAVTGAGVAALALGGWFLASGRLAAAGGPATAIAVLPFESVGGDTANTYFAVGMADEVALALARVPGLQLTGRNSARALRERNATVQEIGRELRVGSVLQGTVRRAGALLRVSAELTNTRSGTVLWTDSYQRPAEDVFRVQDEIAREIVGALAVRLASGAAVDAAPATRGTTNLVAYDEYLRGLYEYSRRGARIPRAIAHFSAAIAADSAFARAWAGLGLSLAASTIYGNVDAHAVLPRALSAAQRAAALDARSAEAFLAMGVVHAYANRWASAEEAYTRALALDSTLVLARMHYGRMLFTVGREEESLRQLERGEQLDPLNANMAATLATGLSRAGRHQDALVVARRAFALDSTVNAARGTLLQSLVNAGRLAEASTVAERILRYVGTDIGVKGQVAYTLGRAGDVTRARALIAEIARDTADVRTDVALLRANLGTGDTTQALDAMERLVASRRPFAVSMDFQTPLFDSVRASPRYVAALHAMGLDPAQLTPGRSRD